MADQHGCRRASAAPRLWKLTPARLLQLSVLAMALQEGSRAANHAHVPLPRRGSMLSAVDLIEQELYGEPVSSDGKSRGDAPPPRVPRHPRRPTLRDPARCRTRKSKEGVKESETRQERERKSKAKSKARRETRRATAKKDERKGRRAEGGFGDWRFQQECFDPEESLRRESSEEEEENDDEESTVMSDSSSRSARSSASVDSMLSDDSAFSRKTPLHSGLYLPASAEKSGDVEARLWKANCAALTQPLLPVGAGDSLKLLQPGLVDDTFVAEDGVVTCLRDVPKPRLAYQSAAERLHGSSAALFLDAAEAVTMKYTRDAELLATIPHHRDANGGLPEYIQRRKDRLLTDWVYEGIVPGDAERKDLEEMMMLPPAKNYSLAESRLMFGTADEALLGRERPGESQADLIKAQADFKEKCKIRSTTGSGKRQLAQDQAMGGDARGGQMVAWTGGDANGEDREEEDSSAEIAPYQPQLGGERDLVLVMKDVETKSNTDSSFSQKSIHPVVAPRWVVEQLRPGESSTTLAKPKPGDYSAMVLKTSSLDMVVPPINQDLVAYEEPVTEQERKEELAALPYLKQAQIDSKLTTYDFVEKYRTEAAIVGSQRLQGSTKRNNDIENAARMSGSKQRGSVSDMSAQGALRRGEAVPKNVVISSDRLRQIRKKLKRKVDDEKAKARDQGDETTPGLMKAREALRYSAGTRVDVIALGARFGKVAEYREIKKRSMRAKGKIRTGPDGLLNRPS